MKIFGLKKFKIPLTKRLYGTFGTMDEISRIIKIVFNIPLIIEETFRLEQWWYYNSFLDIKTCSPNKEEAYNLFLKQLAVAWDLWCIPNKKNVPKHTHNLRNRMFLIVKKVKERRI